MAQRRPIPVTSRMDIQPYDLSQRPSYQTDEHVKRPINPFMLWCKSKRADMLKKNAGMKPSEVSKQLGEGWRNMSEAEKKPFRDESARLKAEHVKNHPTYKYQPKRKPKRIKSEDLPPENASPQRHSSSRESSFSEPHGSRPSSIPQQPPQPQSSNIQSSNIPSFPSLYTGGLSSPVAPPPLTNPMMPYGGLPFNFGYPSGPAVPQNMLNDPQNNGFNNLNLPNLMNLNGPGNQGPGPQDSEGNLPFFY
ncbi:unnamed protein product [Caenorhabditis nigoni]